MLDTPVTTGKPALLWETGVISMEMRIVKRKLNLINHIKKSRNSLANEVFKEQIKKLMAWSLKRMQ